jgi:hypothetical protein
MSLWEMLVIFALGYSVGWYRGHATIAQECIRLGSFYVGKRVFLCTSIRIAATPAEVDAELNASPDGCPAPVQPKEPAAASQQEPGHA